jgi:hypothetical protein
MKTLLRTILVFGLLLIVVHTIVRMNRKTPASTPAAANATLHHASGRVLKIEPAGSAVESYNLCFSIDSFADLPANERDFYEIHERAYVAAHGSRCSVSSAVEAIHTLRPGSALDVLFTQENGAEIVIQQLAVNGENL